MPCCREARWEALSRMTWNSRRLEGGNVVALWVGLFKGSNVWNTGMVDGEKVITLEAGLFKGSDVVVAAWWLGLFKAASTVVF